MDCNVHNIFLVNIGETMFWFLSIQIAVASASLSTPSRLYHKKKLRVGVGSLTELEIMVWHRPLASNSLLALSTSKATFQQAFPAIILRATNDVAVIDFNTVGMFEEKLLFRFCVFLISFMKPIKNILRNGTPKHSYNTKADPNLRCSKMFLQHQITVWRQWPYMGA